ncbi:MAG TPA: hypothetical protein VIJ29_04540 [Candidatus Paceibacterota bacterium]
MKRLKERLVTSPFLKTALGGILSLSLGLVAHAQGTGNTNQLPNTNITSISGVTAVICNFLAYFFWIVIIVSVIMVLYAAFQYVTAGDDTEKTSTARRTITYAAVGIAVALLASAIPDVVGSLFGSNNPGASLNDACTGIGL